MSVPSAATPPHVVIVGAREEVLGKLSGLPYAVTVVLLPDAPGHVASLVARKVVRLDFRSVDALTSAVAAVHADRPVTAVASFTEAGLLPASIVAESIGAAANPSEAVATTLDKARTRAALAAARLSPVASSVASSPDAVTAMLATHPRGVVVKPRAGSGSTGVRLVRQPDDAPAAWRAAATAAADPLVEELLEGVELSVETVSAAGRHVVLAVTGKHVTPPPFFVELGHDMPARVSAETASAATACAVAALDAVGHAYGPAHTEVVVGAPGARIVEVNTRVGGDRIWEMVELTTGVDLTAATLAALCHDALPDPPVAARGASVRFVVADPGTCVGVDGVARALDVPGVVRIGELAQPGATVGALRSSGDRCGYVLAVGADAGEAASAADRAVAEVRVVTRP